MPSRRMDILATSVRDRAANGLLWRAINNRSGGGGRVNLSVCRLFALVACGAAGDHNTAARNDTRQPHWQIYNDSGVASYLERNVEWDSSVRWRIILSRRLSEVFDWVRHISKTAKHPLLPTQRNKKKLTNCLRKRGHNYQLPQIQSTLFKNSFVNRTCLFSNI